MKLTIAQFRPQLGQKKANVDKMISLMSEAQQEGSDLILFPELCITGYLLSEKLQSLAEPLDGPSIKRLQKACRQLSIHAVITFAESNEAGIYNTAALLDDTGTTLGTYRKCHLFNREKVFFQRGNELPVFETKLGRIGIMICYDLEFPEVSRYLRLQQAELILVPTANMSPYESYQSTYATSRAMENEIPLALCNQIGQETDWHFFGQSIVVDAFGTTLTKLEGEEQIMTVQLDLHQKLDPKLNYVHNLHPMMYQKMIKSIK